MSFYSEDLDQIFLAVDKADYVLVKSLSANDTGKTGGHQSGILIPGNSWSMFFDRKGNNGENFDRFIDIHWSDNTVTNSRVIWYGAKKHEYRLTRIKKFAPEQTGSLVVLTLTDDLYQGFVLDAESDILAFLEHYGLTPADLSGLLKGPIAEDEKTSHEIEKEINSVLKYFGNTFPSSEEMSRTAKMIAEKVYGKKCNPIVNPDSALLIWNDIEFKIFRKLEQNYYKQPLLEQFTSLADGIRMDSEQAYSNDLNSLIKFFNGIANRRKSRAGKSFEHLLSEIFKDNDLSFQEQMITEGRKRPDFVFPSIEAYHDALFDINGVLVLAAKTTCKDRWRQILNEADRMKDREKYLVTLQQGISLEQLSEMEEEKVQLIVPKKFLTFYPTEYRSKIWTLKKLINHIKQTETSYPYSG